MFGSFPIPINFKTILIVLVVLLGLGYCMRGKDLTIVEGKLEKVEAAKKSTDQTLESVRKDNQLTQSLNTQLADSLKEQTISFEKADQDTRDKFNEILEAVPPEAIPDTVKPTVAAVATRTPNVEPPPLASDTKAQKAAQTRFDKAADVAIDSMWNSYCIATKCPKENAK